VQYLYHKEAGSPQLLLVGDEHRYIFKVRRQREGERLYLRSLDNNLLYTYHIDTLDKKQASLQLIEEREYSVVPKRTLHIGWCLIDPKSIEKVLPTLNEIGVYKISFIYCDRSQKSFKVDLKRWDKILLNSSQQCGRSQMMILQQYDSLAEYLLEYPQSYLLNFSDTTLSSKLSIESIVIGCEGGVTERELSLFVEDHIVGLDTPLILKSESAACAVASKILL
jgi:16S rRNA (uracil1498-N3)-methyltransferase